MGKYIRIYPKSELAALWAADRVLYSPTAAQPPLCLRCGRPLHPVLTINSLSRYVDIHICQQCGLDEALRDAAGQPLPLVQWDAVKQGRCQAATKLWTLTPACSFSHIFKETFTDGYGHQRPKCALVYLRADHDGRQWWRSWFSVQEDLKTPALAQEVDQFTQALFRLPEFLDLHTLKRLCRVGGEPTSDVTEFNLYSETEQLYIWLRTILRERDYNLYINFYVK